MRPKRLVVACLVVLTLHLAHGVGAAAPTAPEGHGFPGEDRPPFDPAERSAWVALKDSGFVPPPGASAAEILASVDPLLASRDPVLRDEVAYGLAVAWIQRERRVPDEAIRALAGRLRQNLRPGPAGDAVLRRSFSALLLSTVAAADARAPVLAETERAALVDSAAAFLQQEPDTRGYDPEVGWVHATAHAADLLTFLARGPRLQGAEQRTIAAAVLARIDRPGPVFAWGEDERLAAVLGALAGRADFDAAPVDPWLAGVASAWTALWASPVLDTAAFARLTNARHVLQSLHLSLAAAKELSPAARAFDDRVLAALQHFR